MLDLQYLKKATIMCVHMACTTCAVTAEKEEVYVCVCVLVCVHPCG